MNLRTGLHPHERSDLSTDLSRRDRVKHLLLDALQLDADERASLLASEQDASVREDVLRLIAAHERAGTFMNDPSGRFQNDSNAPPVLDELVGTMIGRYRLLKVIGEGGFGRVYLAEQSEPVARQVALKIIRLGMDTRHVIARFEMERQTLAIMEHPGIARVIDAGQTESTNGSRPYFVMELVSGEPITDYCDNSRLDLKSRLELFCLVCHAVQYAHQRGIIHRDLKPANILVSVVDGVAMPKVIDFGIAKAVDRPLDAAMSMTNARELLGTPQYVSPEQADSDELAIDTRTDVYSLGVVLYEMLTGSPPLTAESLRDASYSRMVEMIKQQRTERPSTRALQATARKWEGSLAPGDEIWARRLRGELDWILLKALETDRERRYDSTAALAEDIRRYMHHEPVLAGPPGAAYRIRKFVRRNRIAVVASFLLTLTLLGGVIGTSIGLWRATLAKMEAELQASKARQVAMFNQQMLAGISPALARGKDTQLLRIILDAAATRVDQDLTGQPEVEAAVRFTIGSAYLAIAQYDLARPQLDRSLAIRRSILGNDAPDTLDSVSQMGLLLWIQGKLKEAEPYCQEALDGRRRTLGPDHSDTLSSLSKMGNLRWDQGRLDEAEVLLRESLDVRRRKLGDNHPETLMSINNMGAILRDQGRFAEAEVFYRESLEGHRNALGNDHPNTLAAITNMGRLLSSEGKLIEAERFIQEGVKGYRHVMGDDHPDTLAAINSLAALLNKQNKFDEAEQMYREVLEARRRTLGDDNPATLMSLNNVGSVLMDQGKFQEASGYFSEALERQQRTLGSDHPDTLRSLHNMGALLEKLGRFKDAERAYVEALDGRRRKYGAQSPVAASTARMLARLLLNTAGETHDPQRALQLALEANAATGDKDSEFLDTLATAYFQNGNVEMALQTETRAIQSSPDDSPSRDEYEQRLKDYESALIHSGYDSESSPNNQPTSKKNLQSTMVAALHNPEIDDFNSIGWRVDVSGECIRPSTFAGMLPVRPRSGDCIFIGADDCVIEA